MSTSARYRSFLLAVYLLAPFSVLSGCSALSRGYGGDADDAPRASNDMLTAEQIRNYPSATSVEEILEQHFSGLYFRGVDDRPGGSGTVYMLGNRAPLFVIDGVPIDYNGSLGLNPRDIESIQLVKHGGSAFYGFRGSSGAILITTKGRGD